MIYLKNNFRLGFRYISSDKGITLIELMVAMAIAAIVLMVIYSTYNTQTLINRKETVALNMQQNMRGGLYLMEREIRMAGYDKNDTGGFGIISISDVNGNSSIKFTADLDDDSALDGNETISFKMYDSPKTSSVGILDIGMSIGATTSLAAESIQALFLAYAYDNDGDGMLDITLPPGGNGNVIWAIDSDNDNALDRNLDTNDDGEIDDVDDTNGDGIIEGTALGSNVAVGSIRAVKVWILARTKTPMLKYTDNNPYVVGNRRITPNDNFKRELLVTTIKCRNMGM